jgi:kinetochore protein Mis13/DSN1
LLGENCWARERNILIRLSVTYEEDAEGFQFALLPSKKPRPSIEAVRENPHSDVENAPPKSTPKRGRPRKKQTGDEATSSAVPEKGRSVELPTRRPTRGAAKTTHTEPEFEPTNTIRSSRTRDSPEHQPETKKPKKAGRPPKAKKQAQVSESNGYNSPAQPPEGTKVALPVADTPVIQRNKEFRGGKGDKSEKGRRRSSLSMRGRRASFLIDSGTSNGRFLDLI